MNENLIILTANCKHCLDGHKNGFEYFTHKGNSFFNKDDYYSTTSYICAHCSTSFVKFKDSEMSQLDLSPFDGLCQDHVISLSEMRRKDKPKKIITKLDALKDIIHGERLNTIGEHKNVLNWVLKQIEELEK